MKPAVTFLLLTRIVVVIGLSGVTFAQTRNDGPHRKATSFPTALTGDAVTDGQGHRYVMSNLEFALGNGSFFNQDYGDNSALVFNKPDPDHGGAFVGGYADGIIVSPFWFNPVYLQPFGDTPPPVPLFKITGNVTSSGINTPNGTHMFCIESDYWGCYFNVYFGGLYNDSNYPAGWVALNNKGVLPIATFQVGNLDHSSADTRPTALFHRGTSTQTADLLVVADENKNPLGGFHANGSLFAASSTPANAGDLCSAGTIAWDANFVYVCVAANTWKRSALSSW